MQTSDNTDLASTWGRNIETSRRQAHLTQRQLAGMAHTTQQTISRLEAGTHKPGDALKVRLAKALSLKIGELFGYGDNI